MRTPVADNTVFIIHKVPSGKGVEDSSAFHPVIISDVLIVAGTFFNRRHAKVVIAVLLERVDIALALVDAIFHKI